MLTIVEKFPYQLKMFCWNSKLMVEWKSPVSLELPTNCIFPQLKIIKNKKVATLHRSEHNMWGHDVIALQVKNIKKKGARVRPTTQSASAVISKNFLPCSSRYYDELHCPRQAQIPPRYLQTSYALDSPRNSLSNCRCPRGRARYNLLSRAINNKWANFHLSAARVEQWDLFKFYALPISGRVRVWLSVTAISLHFFIFLRSNPRPLHHQLDTLFAAPRAPSPSAE